MLKKFLFIGMIALSAALAGCEEENGNGGKIEVSSVAVSPAVATLTTVGQRVTMAATVLPQNATDKSVVWSSDNEAVATVDAGSGIVTAVSEGEAEITATAGTKSGKANITVAFDNPISPEPEPELDLKSGKVYAVGLDEDSEGKRLATMWVDGKTVRLSKNRGSWAESVCIDESDNVYAAGLDVVGGAFLPVLWVNGERQLLETTGYGETYSVFVNGTDVYVAGLYDAGGSGLEVRAAFWENGVRKEITTTDGYATAVYADDSGVYVAYWRQNAEGVYQACLWHNDTETVLDSAYSEAYSVTVHNGDVYVTGRENAGGTSWPAVLWINGVKQYLSDEFSYARSIFFDDEDMYIAGLNGNGSFDSAAKAGYWENSDFHPLTDGSASADANAIFVSDGEVYVGGYNTPDLYSYDVHRATIWKNSEAAQLSDYQSEVHGLFVKKQTSTDNNTSVKTGIHIQARR
jgi:hypothetical protein